MRQKLAREKSSRKEPAQIFEYVLLITPRYNEQKKRLVTVVALRTVKEFSNYRYEMIVENSLDDRRLRLNIMGLRPPELTFPGLGPATFETEYDNLNGSYEVVVTKLHKDVNIFRVHITPEKAVVKESPKSRFVDLVTRPEDW